MISELLNNRFFLGGTCGDNKDQWDWRKDVEIIVRRHDLTYFDPFIRPWETDDDWDEEKQKEEIKQRNNCLVSMYIITSDIKGIYSFCEAVEDSIKKKNHCIVGFIDYKDRFSDDKSYLKSIDAWLNLCERNGAIICRNMADINNAIEKISTEIKSHDNLFFN